MGLENGASPVQEPPSAPLPLLKPLYRLTGLMGETWSCDRNAKELVGAGVLAASCSVSTGKKGLVTRLGCGQTWEREGHAHQTGGSSEVRGRLQRAKKQEMPGGGGTRL